MVVYCWLDHGFGGACEGCTAGHLLGLLFVVVLVGDGWQSLGGAGNFTFFFFPHATSLVDDSSLLLGKLSFVEFHLFLEAGIGVDEPPLGSNVVRTLLHGGIMLLH